MVGPPVTRRRPFCGLPPELYFNRPVQLFTTPNPPLSPGALEAPPELVRGVIVDVARQAKTYRVKDRASDNILEGCRWAAGEIFAPLFGFCSIGLLELGTEVIVLRGNPHFVIKALPSRPGDQGGRGDGAAVGDGRPVGDRFGEPANASASSGDDVARDMVEGEISISNAFGVGIDFLMGVMRIRAGRAFIETCLRDDTVRMAGRQLKLHTSVGDTEHLDDGRLNMRESFTSYSHESWGKLTPEEAKLTFIEKGTPTPPNAEDLTKTGRWRSERYLGFLGDFIHHWICSPEAVLGDLAQQGTRSGSSHHWQGADGTLLWQSVSEIAFERVVRIVVPKSKAAPGPAPDEAYYRSLEASFLRIWDRGVDFHKTHHTAFQIREYSRWLSQFMGLARFHQQPDRYEVPSEAGTPAPEWTAKEADREQANGGPVPAYTTYATIRIMRDGGIMALEGGGGCLLLTGGRGFVSVPYDLNFESGGDMRFTAGKDIWMKARRNMTLSSSVGGIAIKARTFWRALCEQGTLWLKSDMMPAEATGGDVNNPAPEKQAAAVLIEAPRAGLTITSAGQTLIDNQGATAVDAATPGGLVLQAARGDVVVKAKRRLGLTGESGISLNSVGALVMRVGRVIGELTANQFIMKGFFSFSGGLLHVPRVVTDSVSSTGGYAGPSDRVSRVTSGLPSPNLGNSLTVPDSYPATTLNFFAVPADRVPWRFPAVVVPAEHPIMESLSQQRMFTEAAEAGITYSTWNPAVTDTLRDAPGTDKNSLPFPGALQKLVHRAGTSLQTPSSTAPSALPAPTALTTEGATFRYILDPTS